ncbi:MAG: type II toxin-antitoxin system RatA family toxin [Gammaproteobacteria bacterium]|nr:type II toxin-antitoxin system RatA family toxin [Gammaproteobacteria bacterium]
MFFVKQSAIVPYSPKLIYALVNDVKTYPDFLPGCQDAKVLRQKDNIQDVWVQFKKGPVLKEWITRNTLISGKQIEMQLVSGPFHHLQGVWQFTPIAREGCQITLVLEASFKSSLLKWVGQLILKDWIDHLVRAFCQRAETVYGNSRILEMKT